MKQSFIVSQKRILVVEDNEDISKPLVFRLRKKGFQVLTAPDGRSGLTEARLRLPHLIILDLHLPFLSGEEVCKAIREDDDETIRKIPIIMLTAKSSEADRIVGKVIGANSYVTKPYDPIKLFREIEIHLELNVQ